NKCGTTSFRCDAFPGGCCAGFFCNPSHICQPSTPSQCGQKNAPCTLDSHCCSGFHCSDNFCEAGPPGCGAFGDDCVHDEDCCPGKSCNGTGKCQLAGTRPSCGFTGDSCSTKSDCCSGYSCLGGKCDPNGETCNNQVSCLDDAQCCPPF